MKGFTLLEICMAMAIGSLVTTLMLVTLTGGLNVSSRLRGEQEVLLRAELLTSRLEADLCETDLSRAVLPDAHTLTVPVALDAAGHFQSDPATGVPLWSGNHTIRQDGDWIVGETRLALGRNLTFVVTSVNVTDPVTLLPVVVPTLVNVSAQLLYRDRRGAWAGHAYERSFFAKNSLLALHRDIIPDLDDPPPAALTLPDIPEHGPLRDGLKGLPQWVPPPTTPYGNSTQSMPLYK